VDLLGAGEPADARRAAWRRALAVDTAVELDPDLRPLRRVVSCRDVDQVVEFPGEPRALALNDASCYGRIVGAAAPQWRVDVIEAGAALDDVGRCPGGGRRILRAPETGERGIEIRGSCMHREQTGDEDRSQANNAHGMSNRRSESSV